MGLNSEWTEQELIQGLARGSESAFDEIYRRYWKVLLGIALSHADDETIAEEMVQEVFVRLWERRGQVNILSLPAYLAKSVKFAVFNNNLKARRQRSLLEAGYRPDLVQRDDAQIYARFTEEYLAGVIDRLPQKCQVVFRYSREQGLSLPEIAGELDISVKTAEGHLTKALKILRLSLKDFYTFLLL